MIAGALFDHCTAWGITVEGSEARMAVSLMLPCALVVCQAGLESEFRALARPEGEGTKIVDPQGR